MNATVTDISYGKAHVHSVPGYIAGKAISTVAQQYGIAESAVIKLASNENPLGMSSRAQQALLVLATNPSSCYPEVDASRLRAKLAEEFSVPVDWIIMGNGSSEIIELAARAFAGLGDSVVMSQYSFALYPLAAKTVGARPIVVPALDYGHDLGAMLTAIDASTTLTYVANPNNPTGTMLDQGSIEKFLTLVPEKVIVVLDEAYCEYLPNATQTVVSDLVARYANLILLRTLSKAYGLAGLRIGYAVAQPGVTQILNRVRAAFNTNTFAQAAAIAALDDRAFLHRTREMNDLGKAQLYTGFSRLNLPYLCSAGNFVMVHVGDGERIAWNLLEQGIIVRPVSNYGLQEWLRVSVGLPEQNELLLTTLSRLASLQR